MSARKRSAEGRRRGRSRYRESKKRRTSTALPTTPLPSTNEGPELTPAKVDDDEWVANIAHITNLLRPSVIPPLDGTGVPAVSQWDVIDFWPRYEKLAMKLAEALNNRCEKWINRPQVHTFLTRFEKASREEQKALSGEWIKLGLEREAEGLAAEFAALLEKNKLGRAETLLKGIGPESEVRGRLLEVVSRVTASASLPEDSGSAALSMYGVSMGIGVDVVESPEVWPPRKMRGLRRGESDHIRWTGSSVEDLPPRLEVADDKMKALLHDQIQVELDLGRLEAISLEEFRRRGGKAVSPLNVIWKDDQHTRIRIISNYRVSGVNWCSLGGMDTTVCYPGLPQIQLLLKEAGDVSSLAMAEYDIKSAYRLLPLHRDERPYMAVRDVRPSSPVDSILYEKCAPFGAVGSALGFVRVNANVHRVQRRLLYLMMTVIRGKRRPKGFIYVDDSRWMLRYIIELVALLLIVLVFRLELEYSKVFYRADDCRILGWRADLVPFPTLSLPQEKGQKYSSLIRSVLTGDWIDVESFEKIIGKLAWGSQLIKEWRPHLASLYALKKAAQKYQLRRIKLGPQAIADLHFFVNALEGLVPRIPVASLACNRWFLITDASTVGVGGCLINDNGLVWWFCLNSVDNAEEWARLRLAHIEGSTSSGRETSAVSGGICFLELAAVFLGVTALESYLEDQLEGSSQAALVFSFCDNAAAVSAIDRWSSKSNRLRAVLSWAPQWVGRLNSQHLQGVDNVVADFISRHSRAESERKVPKSWRYLELNLPNFN